VLVFGLKLESVKEREPKENTKVSVPRLIIIIIKPGLCPVTSVTLHLVVCRQVMLRGGTRSRNCRNQKHFHGRVCSYLIRCECLAF
jgi:hypothetical protein